jgi:hypothetical protein
MIIEHDHLSIFDRSAGFCGLQSHQNPKMLNSPAVMAPVSTPGILRHGEWLRERGEPRQDRPDRAGEVDPDRPAVFDALCSHLDEIETLPPNSQVLAANELSAIQAIPPSGWVEGFHLRAIEHARHTTNPLAREGAQGCGRAFRLRR